MDSTRRTILAAGVAAAAAAAVPDVFAQQSAKSGKFYERGPVRIYYEEAGSGFPLLLLPGGAIISSASTPFSAVGLLFRGSTFLSLPAIPFPPAN